jgi:phospholipase C
VLFDRWIPTEGTDYDLSVYGPNGFFRRVAGGLTHTSANLEVRVLPEIAGDVIVLVIENVAETRTTVTIANQYTDHKEHFPLEPRARITLPVQLATSFHWYDVLITVSTDPSFVRHYAGHIENGSDGVSDPHIGA